MPLRSSKIQVTAVPVLPIYRAMYKNHSAYGRTPEQAVDRLKLQYKKRRLTVGDIGDAVGNVLLSPFL